MIFGLTPGNFDWIGEWHTATFETVKRRVWDTSEFCETEENQTEKVELKISEQARGTWTQWQKLVKSSSCAAVMHRSAQLSGSVDCFIFASAFMLSGVNKRVGSSWSLWCSCRNQTHAHGMKQLWTDEILHRCSHFYPLFKSVLMLSTLKLRYKAASLWNIRT